MFEFQFRKFTLPGVAALVLGLGIASLPAASQAATCDSPTDPDVTYALSQGTPDGVQDSACFDGNDTNLITSSFSLFGLTDWILGQKVDYPAAGGTAISGDGTITFATAPQPGATAPAPWSVNNPNNYTNIVVTLKQADSFAAFLLDPTEALSGIWSTQGPGGATNDLSHTSVYYQGVAPIPLPAGGLLLVTALGGLGFAARRRRKAS